MTKLLTPQEALQALLYEQKIEFAENNTDYEKLKWYDFSKHFSINYILSGDFVFRLKQQMTTVGSVSFPKPLNCNVENLVIGETYYMPKLPLFDDIETDGVTSFEMPDSNESNWVYSVYLKNHLVHETRENAVAHTKALIKLSGGEL